MGLAGMDRDTQYQEHGYAARAAQSQAVSAALFLRGLHHHGRREQYHADKRCYSHESLRRHINARAH